MITENNDITISSFDIAPDDLLTMVVGVLTALQLKHPTPFIPRTIINEYDEFYGNSVTIKYKYQHPV